MRYYKQIWVSRLYLKGYSMDGDVKDGGGCQDLDIRRLKGYRFMFISSASIWSVTVMIFELA